ncbi:MAG: AAA family ATPase [Candidatus Binatia bacterium]|nr:AAA family ATPase [Candidatus Binatia bacterium]
MARTAHSVLESDEELTDPGPNSDKQPEIKAPALTPRGINEFLVPPDNDATILLGNRYLCRGDGLVMVSSSGMGKSAMAIQAAVTWCFGLPFMGIAPNGCLRSLIIQSEDSDGDIGEIWASICFKMNLTVEQRAIAHERVVIVTDRLNRGPIFLAELKRQVAAGKYDLVWINPLAAFLSGDATTQETAADFLRAGLNGINTPPTFGYIIVQHTTKPATGKEKREREWFEVMYDMAGSYDIIGWARSIISIRPTPTFGEFNMVLAKRGRRAGVTKKVPQGAGYRLESAIIIPLKHCEEKMKVEGVTRELPIIFWEPREESGEQPPEKLKGRPKANTSADFMAIFPVGLANARGVNELHREALKIKHLSKGSVYTIIDDAMAQRRIVCDSTNPKAPLYYIAPQTSAPRSESSAPLFEPDE